MIAELVARVRGWLGKPVAEGLRTTSEQLREQLEAARQAVLDETDALASDGEDLAARIRRNASRGGRILAGERHP